MGKLTLHQRATQICDRLGSVYPLAHAATVDGWELTVHSQYQETEISMRKLKGATLVVHRFQTEKGAWRPTTPDTHNSHLEEWIKLAETAFVSEASDEKCIAWHDMLRRPEAEAGRRPSPEPNGAAPRSFTVSPSAT